MLHGVVVRLSQTARELQAASDLDQVLKLICGAALLEIPPAVAASITMTDGHRFYTAAATSHVIQQLDDVQYRTEDGPCVTALRENAIIRSDDLASEARWPEFAAEAVHQGLRALMSFQLFDQDDDNSALNVYSGKPNAWTCEAEDAGLLLASHAALTIRAKRVEANLRTALSSRDLIGQAKGILMERFKLNADQAFQTLIAVSQHTHCKLRDISEELCMTGDLPDLR